MKIIPGAKYVLDRNAALGGARFKEGEVFKLISYDGKSELARFEQHGEEYFLTFDHLQLVADQKPPHYDTGIDTIAFMRANCPPEQVEGFLRGNALKYLQRYDRKSQAVSDLKKCRHYLDMLIEEVEGRG